MRFRFIICLFLYNNLFSAAASYEIKINVAATQVTESDCTTESSQRNYRRLHFDVNGKSPLYRAVESNDIALVTKLLENKEDLEARDMIIGDTPLALAIRNNNYNIVKLLLSNNANPQTKIHGKKSGYPYTALDYAIKKKHNSIAKKLIQEIENRRLRSHGFIMALESNKFIDANHLLSKGILINYKDESGWTPLFSAIFKSKLNFVKILLELKADPNLSTFCGKTPLHIACNNGDDKIVNLLLNACADNSSIDKNLVAPLVCAIMSNNTNCVKLLLEDKANVSTPDHHGNSVIDLAIRMGNKEIIKLLRQNENCCAIQ